MRNEKLQAAIETYFDAIYFCDPKRLDQVFHPTASLFDADNGNIFTDPIADFRQDVATRSSPASKDQPRDEEEIIMIDWLSKISATVKLRLRSHNQIFVDHLCFINGENGWQIVAKVWHLESEMK